MLKIHFAVIVNDGVCVRVRRSGRVASVETIRMGFVILGSRLRLRLLALVITASASVAAMTSAQSTSTSLTRSGLDRYPLALCNDGSAAVYYHEQVILAIYCIVETKTNILNMYTRTRCPIVTYQPIST